LTVSGRGRTLSTDRGVTASACWAELSTATGFTGPCWDLAAMKAPQESRMSISSLLINKPGDFS
jgi:hypothetical protein